MLYGEGISIVSSFIFRNADGHFSFVTWKFNYDQI